MKIAYFLKSQITVIMKKLKHSQIESLLQVMCENPTVISLDWNNHIKTDIIAGQLQPVLFCGVKVCLRAAQHGKKGKFLYSAVSNPQDCSKRFTHYFPGRPVQSNTISTSLGSIQPYATINAQRLLVHISTTVYSQVLIYTAEWTGAM